MIRGRIRKGCAAVRIYVWGKPKLPHTRAKRVITVTAATAATAVTAVTAVFDNENLLFISQAECTKDSSGVPAFFVCPGKSVYCICIAEESTDLRARKED